MNIEMKRPVGRCEKRLPIRQMVLDWLPVLPVIIKAVAWMVQNV